ncbi:hypothetical protein LG651_09855 [Tamlana sp. 62-3]|uniref:Organic solvent tolerance-like N-terminal domain-containing protein n=1 Tax=Neotamlana sargassicola TaxID=2883125 RepID=A0A9X1I752_9FLAO|nr:hypothetical protein [Tamlana sargassicola]MCB4808558.1 hypothetical protein [Tamlana sargassicola]
MKKLAVVLAGLFIGATAFAKTPNTDNLNNNKRIVTTYRNAEPIIFIEGGIEFYIYPNGNFNYNTKINYANSRRGNSVIKDRTGKITRIGTVNINYDRFGNITRAGTININYNNAVVSKIGGLHVNYNRNGKIVTRKGSVKINNKVTKTKVITKKTVVKTTNKNRR